jgi:hypothetical protein
MKLAALFLILSVSLSSFGAIVVSTDLNNQCVIYRVTDAGEKNLAAEDVIEDRELYGLTIKDIKFDFEKKSATVEITKRIVLAFDRPLFEKPVVIKAENPNFTFLVNQLNRDLSTFDKVCVNNLHELVWATFTTSRED